MGQVNECKAGFVERGLSVVEKSPFHSDVLINTGVFDLLRIYGRRFGANFPTVFEGTVVMWLIALCALGFAARKGHRWAFVVGIVFYAVDMLALMATFSIWAFGVHGFLSYAGSRDKKLSRSWNKGGHFFNESEMALFSECMLWCARKGLDTADIVRDAIYRQVTALA